MKTNSFRFSLLLLLCSFAMLQGCEKDEDVHPEIQTLEITALSPSTATLKGNLVARGKIALVDHGFIYGFTSELSENNGTRISLGKDAVEGVYTKEISVSSIPNNYYHDNTLYARAFLRNEKGIMYGQVSSVRLPSPNVQSVVPGSGRAGDRITINGAFFSSSVSEVDVTFSNISARVVEVTPSKVVVEVPVGITNNYYSYSQVPVVLNMAGRSFHVTSSFRVIPLVKDFAPKSGPIGTTITISGDNLPNNYYSYYNTIRVYLGETEVSVNNYNTSGIQVVVPHTVTSEKMAVSVVLDGVTTTLPGEFTLSPPTVTSISPATGLAGSSFSIFGTNFAYNTYYYANNIGVTIGDIPASVHYTSSGQLSVTVPYDMQEGNHKVKVISGPHTVEAPQTYKVILPTITGFSPTSGGIGKEVVLNGTFVAGGSYTVYFGSIAAYVHSATANMLRVQVPTGLDAGRVKITLLHGSKNIVAADEFTVLAPTLSSFAPSSGVAGSMVTLQTTGITPDWYTTVKFGTVSTTILGYTDNSIRVAVPSGVSGAMKISVIHNGQTIVSTENYTVLN